MLLANVALPSFVGHWVLFTLLLPIVATIEAVVLARVLKIKPVDSFVTSVYANWRSTIAGLPMGWLMALTGLIPAGFLAMLLPAPYRDPSFQIIAFATLTGGIIPTRFSGIAMAAGNLLVLIPYYFVTVRVERRVVQARHPKLDPELIARAVRWANRITYCVLALLVLWWLLTAIAGYQEAPHSEGEPGGVSPRRAPSGNQPSGPRLTATFAPKVIPTQIAQTIKKLHFTLSVNFHNSPGRSL